MSGADHGYRHLMAPQLRRTPVVAAVLAIAFALVPAPPAVAAGEAEFFGSTGNLRLNAPIIGMAATPGADGYWLVGADGGVFNFGQARFHGSTGNLRLNRPIVSIVRTPSGNGYWLVASDGGVFSFGDARFFGSTGNLALNRPIVAAMRTPSGAGYWLVASDGGVFAFGDARFFGSTGNLRLNQPIVTGMATPAGNGYWLVAADGGVFAFGTATFKGSTGNIRLVRPIVGGAASPSGNGYWMVASDGGVFAFGDAPFHGSTGNIRLNQPIVGMDRTPTGGGYWLVASDGGVFTFPSKVPTIAVQAVATGLSIPWDLAFTPDGTMLFTERPGRLNALVGGQVRRLATLGDVFAQSEGGLLGIAVDPAFGRNRRIYTCFTWTNGSARDVRVVAWTVNGDYTGASRVADPLFSGLPAGSGRHNGCRLEFGPDGALWVGTGDAAQGTNPQNLNSLGGKVLRLDAATGQPAGGNHSGPICTYGHRNVQGLAFRPGSNQAFAVEHGPDRDDEVTRLACGGNGGWDPVPGAYNESVPMTDTAKFPAAMRPTWQSGAPTIATSGATFIDHPSWGAYNGALAVAALKGSQLRLFFLNGEGSAVVDQRTLLTDQGRLRSPVMGPDGSLYVTTSNGSNDRIVRLTPS